MALYEDLQVFKSAYDLYLILFRELSEVPREIRYTLLQDLRSDVMQVLVLVYRANSSYDKTQYLEQAKDRMVRIKIYLRILSDTHSIPAKKYVRILEKVTEVSKQLTSWSKYVKENSKVVTGSES